MIEHAAELEDVLGVQLLPRVLRLTPDGVEISTDDPRDLESLTIAV